MLIHGHLTLYLDSLSSDALPILQLFHLTQTGPGLNPFITSMVSHCPRLQDLHLCNVHIPLSVWSRPSWIPWSALTSLSLSETYVKIYINELLLGLETATNLTSLSLSYPDLRSCTFTNGPPQPRRLPQLKELRLESNMPVFFSSLLRNIQAPNLTCLAIDNEPHWSFPENNGPALWDDTHHTAFLGFIAFCKDSLEHLVFNVQTYLPRVDGFLVRLRNLREGTRA